MLMRAMDDVPWLPRPNRLEMILSPEPPPSRLITSSFLLVFDGDALLLVDHVRRGWQVPAGHLEIGEPPQVAAQRECLEEAAVQVKGMRLVAHGHVHIAAPRPEGYSYPYPDSYQVFYTAALGRLLPFFPGDETRGRRFFVPAEAGQVAWVQQYRAVVDAAGAVAAGLEPVPVQDAGPARRLGLSLEDAVEERIRSAQARGEFDDLPGKGRPLHLREEDPFVPADVRFAHGRLADAGFAPDWAELAKEIDADLARCRVLLQRDRRGEAEALLERVRSKVRLFNLKVPSLSLQKRLPRLQDLE